MSKGYWVTFYRKIHNGDAMAAYAKQAGPPIQAGGGKFLARTTPTKTYEGGLNERAVVIEFESVEKAISTFESAEYQAAAKLLVGAVEGHSYCAGSLRQGNSSGAEALLIALFSHVGAKASTLDAELILAG
jgi:uncharacterized protein (DUF1330 family)